MKLPFLPKCILFLALVTLFNACKKDKKTTWDANYLVPIARTSIGVDNAFGNFATKTSGNQLDFVYSKELYNNSPALIEIPDTGITTSFTLNSLQLGDRTITRNITLGEINPLFLLLDGSTTNIDAQTQNNLDPIDVDGSEFFETALLESGEMIIEFKNELPVNLRTLNFDLVNKSDGSIIASSSFTNVAPNTTASRTIDLSGKRVNAAMQAVIKLLETDASNGPVKIDAQKGLNITISVRNLKAKEATAAFPDQTVINQDEELTQFFDGAELKYVKVRSGKLKLNLFTSIEENMTLYLKIPSASKNGQIIDEVVKVAGASGGVPTTLNREIDLTGYTIDYRGKNPSVRDTVNTFYQIMLVTLDSSGRKLNVSLSDSINISYTLQDIVPDYAIGYMGNNVNETGDAIADLDIFDKLGGKASLADLTMRLKLTNGVGAEGSVLTRNLISYNSKTKAEVPLTASVINSNYGVSSALFSPFTPQEQVIEFNTGNSNIKNFVENIPDKVKYNMQIAISPNGNNNNWRDFAYYDSRFKVDLELTLPAAFSLDNLSFRDSIAFDIQSIENTERIKGGTFNLFYENSFPFTVNYMLELYDENGAFLDTLGNDGNNMLQAGQTNNPSKGKAELHIPSKKVAAVKKAKYAYITLLVNTPNNTQVQLNSNDKCKVDISADFIYELSGQ